MRAEYSAGHHPLKGHRCCPVRHRGGGCPSNANVNVSEAFVIRRFCDAMFNSGLRAELAGQVVDQHRAIVHHRLGIGWAQTGIWDLCVLVPVPEACVFLHGADERVIKTHLLSEQAREVTLAERLKPLKASIPNFGKGKGNFGEVIFLKPCAIEKACLSEQSVEIASNIRV